MPLRQRIHEGNDRSKHVTEILMIVVVLSFAGLAAYSYWEFIDNKNLEADKESVSCLKNYEVKSCNPFSPTEECQELIKCIKMDKVSGVMFIKDIISQFTLNFKENVLIPLIVVTIIGLIQVRRRV